MHVVPIVKFITFPDYIFDGHENDNIRWMNNDIAVVKVDEEFDFTRRVRGCDFVPKPICYNNMTVQYEKPGTSASVAGWGSTEKYNDVSFPTANRVSIYLYKLL